MAQLHRVPLHPLPLHLGALHPFEQALTLVLAFGPFVVLGIVVWLRRREDGAAQRSGEEQDELSP